MILTELPAKTESEFYDEYMRIWAAWMLRDRVQKVRAGSVGECYTSMDNARARSYAKLDTWIACRVDDTVNDIGERHPSQKAVLYQHYGIAAVYHFPRGDGLLTLAKRNVIAGLRR
jgi:hypothetical protein